MGILFRYLESIDDEQNVTVSLISDHGQGYLVKDSEQFLSDGRTKVPFMFRAPNLKSGICNELIEGIDLIAILSKLSELDQFDLSGKDCNLPVYFGGDRERELTYTESIHVGSTYKSALNLKEGTVFFESEGIVGIDGRFELGNYKIIYELNDKNIELTVKDKNYYLNVIFKHINKYIKI